MPVEVFCSYAHEDEAWLRKLETHLSLLERQGLIAFWHDRLIVPGTNWAKTIDTHLDSASVILLLVSEDFFASNYCVGIEMQRALERQEAGEAFVVPILIRAVNWTAAPFAHLQALPTDAKPLATWQDEETALADVAAGIRRTIERLPLLAASAPRAALPALWNIPYPRNPFFLGRDDELAQLRSHLQAGQTTALSQPQAISGLGGIGKTQLALEYAYRAHQDYQAVLWARAESTEALVSSYVAIASLLRLPEREAKEQDLAVQAVKTWLQTHRVWLLILDNADELTLLPDFLPPAPGGHLLLTTRAAATGRLAHRLEIETLLPEQGALFLLRRAGLIVADATLERASAQERELALQITQELGGLPLALDQAGAYLEETGMDLVGYLQIYQQYRADLLQQRGGLVADHPAPVTTTWSLSFRRVEERNPAAADLVRLCAFLAPDAIAEEILTAGASVLGPVLAPVAVDAFRRNQAIEALRAYSLVRRDPKEKTISVHRLVQAVLQNTLEEAERRSWAKRVVLAVNAAFSHPEHSTWPQCERLLPHALLAAQYIETDQIISEESGRLLHEVATYLRDRARYTEAEPLYQRALAIREQQLGPQHPDVAASFDGLAYLYYEQGKYTEAEPLYQRALAIREQQLGPQHPDVARSLNNLAMLYYVQGKYGEAEPLYQRALRIFEQQLGPERPQTALPLNNLAEIYRKQGKYTEAEPLYQRALRIFELQGPEHPQVAYPLFNMAELSREQGKYVEAEPLYQRALCIWEQQLGPEHPLVADPLTGLANLSLEQGKYEQAEPLYQRALHILEQAWGSQHPDTAETMHGLARLRDAQGNSEEAIDWYARALAIREQALGVHHPKTTETRNRITALLDAMGQHEETAQLEVAQSEQGTSKEERETHPEE
jgi:tetratricopeptide (TPR) repeat protein